MKAQRSLLFWPGIGFIMGIGSWLMADFLMERGFDTEFYVGALILLTGIRLALHGLERGTELTNRCLAFLTMGIFPTLLLLFQYFQISRCSHDPGRIIIPCTDFPQGYLYLALFYGALAGLGILWKLLKLR